jgi:CDP-diglyceride synthetase
MLGRSAFILRFASTIALWTIALLIVFFGYEMLFWLLISVFGMIGLLEFYRMLDHTGLPNFKITGLLWGAVMLAGSFFQNRTSGAPMISKLSSCFFSC